MIKNADEVFNILQKNYSNLISEIFNYSLIEMVPNSRQEEKGKNCKVKSYEKKKENHQSRNFPYQKNPLKNNSCTHLDNFFTQIDFSYLINF
jgi:hypothetical protein